MAQLPSLTFVFGEHAFDLSVQDYLLVARKAEPGQPAPEKKAKRCVPGIIPLNLPNSGHTSWVLGDLFMSNFFLSFDLENRRVAIGRPRVGTPLQERVKKLAKVSQKPMMESIESPETD